MSSRRSSSRWPAGWRSPGRVAVGGLVVAAVVVAVGGALAVLFRAATTGPSPVAAGSPAPRPTDAGGPHFTPGPAAAPPPASLSARPGPGTSTAATGPAPFIQTFAGQPGVRPLTALPSPTATLAIPANVDGCDRGYGTTAQCIPWTFPEGVTDKCAWLTARGFDNVRVTGKDRHDLDPDGNGAACDR